MALRPGTIQCTLFKFFALLAQGYRLLISPPGMKGIAQ